MKKIALFLTVSLAIGFTSCQKTVVTVDPCQEKCQMDPMRGWCGTPPVQTKYFFNTQTQQCEEYIHIGDSIPFETLQECQNCDCSRKVVAD